jgi:hypothetical protein
VHLPRYQFRFTHTDLAFGAGMPVSRHIRTQAGSTVGQLKQLFLAQMFM